MPASTANFGIECSRKGAGSYFACGNGSMFVGCCDQDDACAYGCDQSFVYDLTFDPSEYDLIPALECSEGLWYICQLTVPPFMGCCTSNPCSSDGGCPTLDRRAARLPADASLANHYDPQPPLTTSSESQTALSSDQSSYSISIVVTTASGTVMTITESVPVSASTLNTATSTEHGTSQTSSTLLIPTAATDVPSEHALNVPALAGGVVGGVIGLLALLAVLWRWHKHIEKSRIIALKAHDTKLQADTHQKACAAPHCSVQTEHNSSPILSKPSHQHAVAEMEADQVHPTSTARGHESTPLSQISSPRSTIAASYHAFSECSPRVSELSGQPSRDVSQAPVNMPPHGNNSMQLNTTCEAYHTPVFRESRCNPNPSQKDDRLEPSGTVNYIYPQENLSQRLQ